MTDKIAFFLAVLVISAFIFDAFFLTGGLPVFLGRKLAEASEWIAFWR